MNQIFTVNKNRDMTEGRGPMIFDNAFIDFEDAHWYVMTKQGIMGTDQVWERSTLETMRARMDKDGSICYNGYDIVRVELDEHSYYKEAMAKAEKIAQKRLDERLKEAQRAVDRLKRDFPDMDIDELLKS